MKRIRLLNLPAGNLFLHKLFIAIGLAVCGVLGTVFCIFFCMSCTKTNLNGRINRKENAQKLYLMAVSSYSEENFSKALDFTEQALRCNKKLYQASLLKAKIFYFTNKNEEAEKTISSLVKKVPDFTEARIWKIRILLQNHKFEEAKALLDRETEFNSTDWRIFYLYALLAEKQENFNLRISMEKQAEQTLNESSRVFIDLASIWITLGLRERALDYLEKAKALSIHPENLENAIRHVKNGDDIL